MLKFNMFNCFFREISSTPMNKTYFAEGLSVTNDQLGFESNLGVSLSYAYKTNIGLGDLSVGLSLGMLDKGLVDPDWIDPSGGNGATDPAIPQGDQNKIVPDFGFGLAYRTDAVFVGLSSTHIVPFEAEFTTNASVKLKNHVYLYGGTDIDVSPGFRLTPSLLLKTDLASMQFDFNVNSTISDKFQAGLSYRMQDAVAVLLGIRLNESLHFGYAYDITTSELSNFSSGTHEAMLRYCFKISIPTPPDQKFRNVRFL